ncbi:MAG: efflux RND transporter permease subunit [Planctomycetes bacterium]|nr:efflux RND transporter permease subunit [Planctomycetota bacterium]
MATEDAEANGGRTTRATDHPLFRAVMRMPVTVGMAVVATLVLGGIALRAIPLAWLPGGFTPPYMAIQVPYPNASPEEVEQKIILPIERILGTVRHVKEVGSNSGANGGFVWIEFNGEADMNGAYMDVRDRMERVRPDLPEDVERINIWKYNMNDDSVGVIAVSYPPDRPDAHYTVDTVLRRLLAQVGGVARVELEGTLDHSVRILLDPSRLRAHHVNLYELVQRLRKDNFSTPAGELTEGGTRYLLRTVARYEDLEEIRNLPAAEHVKVGDVADVGVVRALRDRIVRVDGREALILEVYKESGANTSLVMKDVRARLKEALATQPALAGYDALVLHDQGEWIQQSVDNLWSAIGLGMVLAVIILFAVLRRVRMTLIVATSIPLSVLATLAVLYLSGKTLNIVSMMGITVAVGMLVDNAIVVSENIFRLRQEGVSPADASVAGASEVALAVGASTLTTLIAFAPMTFLGGDDGMMKFYLKELANPICWSLLASLAVALVVIPLAVRHLGGARQAADSRFMRLLTDLYVRAIGWTLRHRWDAVLIVVALTASAIWPMYKMEKAYEMHGRPGVVGMWFDLPENYSLSDADALFRRCESILKEHQEELDFEHLYCSFNDDRGRLRLHLPRDRAPRLETEALTKRLKELIPEFPGVEMRINWQSTERNEADIRIRLFGDDSATLRGIAEDVRHQMQSIPNVLSVETDSEGGQPEIQVTVERELAQKYGILPDRVAGTLSYALRGASLPRFQAADREVDMSIEFAPEFRETMEEMNSLVIPAKDGTEIPLPAIARVRNARSLGEISRENRKTVLSVKVTTTKDDLDALSGEVDARMERFQMPRGYSWDKSGRWSRMRQAGQEQNFALGISLVFVFLLMGVLFESVLLPWAVIVSVPFAFLGVFWTLYLTGTPLDMMAFIGMIVLIGIVVNNAIVLVDCVNRLRASGMDREAALVEAGRRRLRPILLTALTTIAGLLPMALGTQNVAGIPYFPMGRTVMGGLAASTALTLLMVPLCYSLFDDLGGSCRRLAARAAGRL